MNGYLSDIVPSVQYSSVAGDSPPSFDQVSSLPKSRRWNGRSIAPSISEVRSVFERCQPAVASISVLLLLNFEVHLAARSVSSPDSLKWVDEGRPNATLRSVENGCPEKVSWPCCSGENA